MARMPRLVVPDYPHHITQRGNRRMKTFFSEDDYQHYINLLESYKTDAEVEIWAYCLMPNHVHIVAVPKEKDGLSYLFRQVHRHYTRYINFREKWKGHLWQERYHSFVMDEQYLLATVRYVELNRNSGDSLPNSMAVFQKKQLSSYLVFKNKNPRSKNVELISP